jgi:hypothetical protein
MNRFMRGAFALAAIAASPSPQRLRLRRRPISDRRQRPAGFLRHHRHRRCRRGPDGRPGGLSQGSDGKFYKADCNSATAEVRVASAIVLTGSAAGQSVVVQTGGQITIGATLTAGVVYYLSGTAGGIRPSPTTPRATIPR